VNFKAASRQTCPHIAWELVADPLGSAEHILGTAAVRYNIGSFLFAASSGGPSREYRNIL